MKYTSRKAQQVSFTTVIKINIYIDKDTHTQIFHIEREGGTICTSLGWVTQFLYLLKHIGHLHKPGWSKPYKPIPLLTFLSFQKCEVRKIQAILYKSLIKSQCLKEFHYFIFKIEKQIMQLFLKILFSSKLSRYHELTFPNRAGMLASP